MHRILFPFGGLLIAACQTSTAPAPESGPLADIAVFSSRAFAGREVGSPGDDSAAVYLAHRYSELRLHPAFHRPCASANACPESYYQFFNTVNGVAHNVGAIVDGRDSLLRSQYVVVGAHFDHLGHSAAHALDRENESALRPGADDNASGTAAVLALAARLSRQPARRPVLVVNFDAEEEGLLGSRAFLDAAIYPPAEIRFMLNLDMIGRLRDNRLLIEGVPSHSVVRSCIDSLARAAGLRPDFVGDSRRSDHASFEDAGIAVAFLTTGEHIDYHTARDVVERINGPGLLAIIDVAEQILRSVADK
jgi:Zn-dependent M28 family amino/carboxypeptidase